MGAGELSQGGKRLTGENTLFVSGGRLRTPNSAPVTPHGTFPATTTGTTVTRPAARPGPHPTSQHVLLEKTNKPAEATALRRVHRFPQAGPRGNPSQTLTNGAPPGWLPLCGTAAPSAGSSTQQQPVTMTKTGSLGGAFTALRPRVSSLKMVAFCHSICHLLVPVNLQL